jgi:hypothetical protein
MSPSEAHFFIYTQDKIKANEARRQYEVMRLQTLYLLKPYQDSKRPSPTAEKLMPFPWDKKQLVEIDPADWTEERFKEAERRYRITKA